VKERRHEVTSRQVSPAAIVSVEPRYENFIGGKWLAPTHGKYRVD